MRERNFFGSHWLFVRFTGNAGRLEQLAGLDPLINVNGRALNPKVSIRYLSLVKFSWLVRRAIDCCAQMSSPEEADERGIDRIARPTVGGA